MQTQFEMQTQSEKKREMRKQSDMRRDIFIQEDIKEFERLLNDREDFKNDHEFVAHCHKIIDLIKITKSLNLIRGLYIDIANKITGHNVRHAKCGIYNYPAYQSYQNL
jgi:hypothetical protein